MMGFKDIFNKIFEEKPSSEFENKVFQAVLPELQKNKRSQYKKLSWILIPTMCIGVLVFTQVQKINERSQSEMMTLAEADVDLYRDLDLIEDLEFLESLDDKDLGGSI